MQNKMKQESRGKKKESHECREQASEQVLEQANISHGSLMARGMYFM